MSEEQKTPRPWVLEEHREALVRAANVVAEADALLIGAGAGLGVDAGLPDFRSPRGFWRAYPPAETLGFCYEDVASGPWFEEDPAMAWGFIAHCAELFASSAPHEGYEILRRWAGDREDCWVYTSNIDRHFYEAGFDPEKITEIHGFRGVLQCVVPCTRQTWPASLLGLQVDAATLRLTSPAPRCPHCGALARPNTLMFNDQKWIGDGTREQEERLTDWLQEQLRLERRVAVIELGAGTVVPNVRFQCERYAQGFGTPLIRINPGEPQVPEGAISLPLGALEALRGINALLLGGAVARATAATL